MSSILAIGYTAEKTFNYFVTKAREMAQINIDMLDLSSVAACNKLDIIETGSGLIVYIDEKIYDFENYFAFYNRCFFSNTGQPQKDQGLSKLVGAINAYLEATEKTVVNKHSAGAGNGNKFIHIGELKQFGFNTPATYISGSKSSLQSVLELHPDLINKSCSSLKTIAAKVDDDLVSRASLLENCPSLFQEQITGADVRVHIVDKMLFPEKIVADTIDYRFNSAGRNEYSDIEVPDAIGKLCIEYCKNENLLFAGIDFKINDKGDWYILEVNPMPGYDGYDKRLKGKITNALVQLFIDKDLTNTTNEKFFVESHRRPDISF
jgi:glutathione synthase/RimK-type ligase-like ATP-grasp enzyme